MPCQLRRAGRDAMLAVHRHGRRPFPGAHLPSSSMVENVVGRIRANWKKVPVMICMLSRGKTTWSRNPDPAQSGKRSSIRRPIIPRPFLTTDVPVDEAGKPPAEGPKGRYLPALAPIDEEPQNAATTSLYRWKNTRAVVKGAALVFSRTMMYECCRRSKNSGMGIRGARRCGHR